MRFPFLIFVSVLAFAASAAAQSAEPVPSGASTGYELTLTGATQGDRGHALKLTGVAHEVNGLASLSPRAGLEVTAEITARRGSGHTRHTVTRANTRSEAGGRFEITLDVPTQPLSAPRIELTVARAGQPGRLFTFPLHVRPDEALDLLTDRNRYQPGEDVRVWVRVRGERAEVPHAGRPVVVTLTDPRGATVLARHEGETAASGVVTAALTLPESAEPGQYRVVAQIADPEGGPSAQRYVQVWRRTVERLLGEVELRGADEDGVSMVVPGAPLRGRVIARTPSGTPVRGASVELRVRPDAEPTTLTTGADGAAEFDVRAPAYLSGDVASQQIVARIVHPAHGTITASATYILARVAAVVSVTPRGGALVPEVEQTLYVSVSDPRGRPLAGGTEVVVRGEGIAGGEAAATIDAEGFAEVVIELPRGAASTMRTGDCAGQVATTLEVEVRTDPPRFSRVCAQVAPDAQVAPILAGPPLVAPGATLDVEVRRRPSARGRPVLLEALFDGRAVAASWVDGRASRGALEVPSDLLGRLTLRARAVRDENATEATSEPGATSFGVGAFDGVLVRPADAFALEVTPGQERYLVRDRAEVTLAASRAPSSSAWGALLVRDQAAHGGEGPWDLYWMRGAIHEAAQQPEDEANARLLRVSLAGALGLDPEPPAPPPLERPYWRPPEHHGPYRPGMQIGRGVLRDPIALREELLRRGLGPFETTLEQIVRELGTETSARAPIVDGGAGRVRFDRDVIAHLVSTRRLSDASARTLGGEPLTVAMIEDADPGFSFDTVARRVARERLSKLLLALLRLTDPDDPNAQRASANLPPERWLGTLVQLGMVAARDLSDPWGRAFVFRRVTGRPVVAVSERALEWELASPGPDGRLGNADDVKDPFARVVPEGTPYAVVSGEEALMQRMSTLAPAGTVLTRMSQAYDRLSLAAREEGRAGPVTASSSEIADETVTLQEPAAGEMAQGFGGLGMVGTGRGGGGVATRRSAAAPAPMEEGEADYRSQDRDGDGILDSVDQNRAEAMGTLIREDFPATLFFVGEVALENGRARVEVPLADALTTYRLEAIAWTGSGWTTSGEGRLSVDQEALVDAPVPPFATVGDRIRLPVRVENRTDAPLPVSLLVEAEGELSIDAVDPVSVEVPPRSAREAVVEIALRSAGEGTLVVSAASGERGLDAVRRPMRVLADARTARDYRTRLVDGAAELTVEVPPEATERGPAQVRVAVGPQLFGDPTEIGNPLWAGWALAMAREPLTDEVRAGVLPWVTYEDDDTESLREPLSSALALSAAWGDERLRDPDAGRALRAVSQALPAPEAMRTMPPGALGDQPSWLLLALAPMALDLDRRPALREDAERVLSRLRQLTSSHAAQATDAPNVWARAAAALALSDGALSGGDGARAREMVRRTDRHRISVGDMAWIEPEQPRGQEPRAQPTALVALAQIALGDRASALALVRSLIDMHRAAAEADDPVILRALVAGHILPRPPWVGGIDRALASAAAARLAPPGAPSEVRITVDGRPVEVRSEEGVHVAVLEGLGRPGTHVVSVALGSSEVALAHLALTYGMPWDVAPRRRAPLELAIDGEVGARETRAGLLLTVQNRGARILTRPVVEIELPAGAELDEPTREALASHLRGDAHQDGRTLLLPLRPLAPGAWIRLPIPARWAVGGALRGLGVVGYDALGPDRADVLPVAVLPSREVAIPDEGPEPERPDMEASEDPPIPIPPPIPLLERIRVGRES